jgi:hypothetical protein
MSFSAEIVQGPAPGAGFAPDRTVPLKQTKPEPSVMKDDDRPPVVQNSQLTDEETAAAKSELLAKSHLKFLHRLTSKADPSLNLQRYCLHSFTAAPGATPDKDGVFGVMRFRGAFPTEAEADERAEYLIRNVDSVNGIYVGYVGRDFPLTAERLDFVAEMKEHDLKQKIDTLARDKARQAKDDEVKARQEIEQRAAELAAPPDPNYERTLRHYTTLQTKIATIKYNLGEIEKKRVELTAAQAKNEEFLLQLNQELPDFNEQFVGAYKAEMESIGLKDSPLLPFLIDQCDAETRRRADTLVTV